jgi:hypothetical protein
LLLPALAVALLLVWEPAPGSQTAYGKGDGTDDALVLGWLFSFGLAGLFLISAVASIGVFFLRDRKSSSPRPRSSGKLAVLFLVSGLLCGLSVPSGQATYNMFEHRRGYINPRAHVIEVAIASMSGPIVAGIFASYFLGRKRNARGPN